MHKVQVREKSHGEKSFINKRQSEICEISGGEGFVLPPHCINDQYFTKTWKLTSRNSLR